MADGVFPKKTLRPSDSRMPPIPDDYRPKTLRMKPILSEDAESHRMDRIPDEGTLDEPRELANQIMRTLELELTRKPLNEIATIVRGLTYGEMLKLAEEIWSHRSEGETLDHDTLPTLLYRWSVSCKD
jgi:hypothetical protein